MSQEEKIAEAEREVAEGEARQRDAKLAYDTIVVSSLRGPVQQWPCIND
jgi:hypothetical protein